MAQVKIHQQPKIAQKAPFPVQVEAGKTYYWCSCGHSKKQPFCDGNHSNVNKEQSTQFAPLPYKATSNTTVYFCGCKATKNAPLCDGSHDQLK